MRYATLPPLLSSLLLVGRLATAAPVVNADEDCVPYTICVDGVNACGIRWGGCYNVCDAPAMPVAPPCPGTEKPPSPTTRVTTKVTTLEPKPTTTKATTTKGHTVTKTVETPSPTTRVTTKVTTLEPKPTTTKKTTTKGHTVTKTVKPPVTPIPTKFTTSTTRPSSTCSTDVTVCWDGINECGMMYGGCFPDCKPWPTFTPPPCPTTTTKQTPTVITSVTTLPILTVPHP
ncbi:hypothetical protein VTG60DRAFT_202 [Thermothelomyces hinnuleus]